jgi:hypothetical protein
LRHAAGYWAKKGAPGIQKLYMELFDEAHSESDSEDSGGGRPVAWQQKALGSMREPLGCDMMLPVARQWFNAADSNDSQTLDLGELKALLRKMEVDTGGTALADEEMEKAFHAMDTSGDGIKFEEFAHWLGVPAETCHVAGGKREESDCSNGLQILLSSGMPPEQGGAGMWAAAWLEQYQKRAVRQRPRPTPLRDHLYQMVSINPRYQPNDGVCFGR